MEEIPVEYNIIIEALSCAVQNQQQAEGNEGQTNFEFVVINNASDDQVQAQGPTTLQCIEQSQHRDEHVEAQVTFHNADNTSTTTSDAPGVPTEGQNVETAQATEAIQPRAKTHKCDLCNKTFSYAGSLRRHAKSHEEKTRYDCTECDKSFTQLGDILRHQRNHTGNDSYKCMHCDMVFSRLEAMKMHQNSHSNEKGDAPTTNISTGKELSCQVCNQVFEKMSLLKKHLKSHDGVKVKVKAYQCNVCHEFFEVESAFNVHKRTHTGEKPHACDQCDKRFSQMGNLNRHKITHTDQKPFQCETCRKTFNRMDLLKTHKKIHALIEQGFPCNLCAEVFSLKADLKCHKKMYHPVLRCKTCKSKFSDTVQFDKHLKTHRRDNPFKCNICEMCYSDAESLVNHIAGHAKKEHKCEICGRVFGQLGSMKQHVRKHTGERPYTCDVCGMSFSQVGNMRRHKKNHTDVRPYKCSSCPKTFKRMDLMKTHEKVHLPKSCRGQKRKLNGETSQVRPPRPTPDAHQLMNEGTSQAGQTSQTGETSQIDGANQTDHDVQNGNVSHIEADQFPQTSQIGTETSQIAHIDAGESDQTYITVEASQTSLQTCEVSGQTNKEGEVSQIDQTSESGKIYQCAQCDDKFSDTTALALHMKTHDVAITESSSQRTTQQETTAQTSVDRQVNPRKKPHSCEVCNKTFEQQSALVTHKRTHTGEKPFACDNCDLRFAQRGNLVRHQRKHSGIRPFKCQFCGKDFDRKDFLKLHETKCNSATLS